MTEIQVTEEYQERMAARTTRRTKAQLLEEIEELKDVIKHNEEEIKKLERFKVYENCASDLAAFRDSLIDEGFTEEQAFELAKQMIVSAAEMNRPKFPW